MLTELAVKNAKPKQAVYRINDGRGLQLEVTPSGGKLWRWRYYYAQRQHILALGKYPTVSLSEARKRRDEGLVLLESGKHPGLEKKSKKKRLFNDAGVIFRESAKKWLDAKKAELEERYHAQIERMLERYVYHKIGVYPMSEISAAHIVDIITPIAADGKIETANRIKIYISQIFRHSIQSGLRIANPTTELKDVLPSNKEEHHACISAEQVPDFFEKLKSKEESLGKLAIELISLTFVRTSELLPAKWSEINWDKSEWDIPAERMKMGRAHVVPLSSQAVSILRRLKKLTGDRTFLFYSHVSKSKYVSNNTILKMIDLVGYKRKMTGHGFRTLASTILNEKQYASEIIEKQLAHEDENKVRSAYNRAEYLPQRKLMMQDYADILDCMRERKEYKPKAKKKPK